MMWVERGVGMGWGPSQSALWLLRCRVGCSSFLRRRGRLCGHDEGIRDGGLVLWCCDQDAWGPGRIDWW